MHLAARNKLNLSLLTFKLRNYLEKSCGGEGAMLLCAAFFSATLRSLTRLAALLTPSLFRKTKSYPCLFFFLTVFLDSHHFYQFLKGLSRFMVLDRLFCSQLALVFACFCLHTFQTVALGNCVRKKPICRTLFNMAS